MKKFLVYNAEAPLNYAFRIYTEEQLNKECDELIAAQDSLYNCHTKDYYVLPLIDIKEYAKLRKGRRKWLRQTNDSRRSTRKG